MSDHIVKSYDRDLEALGRRIAEMGGVAEKMLAEAMDALSAFDVDLAHRVVSSDPRLDALQREIEENAILTIARRQPLAVDLREMHRRDPHFRRYRAHRRSRQEHRQAHVEDHVGGARAARHRRSEIDA